jgi:hypothetical protein
MSTLITTKTTFAAGELDPRLSGRLDLGALQDGGKRLRNVVVHATGGVSRRPGTRLLLELPGARRIVSLEGQAWSSLLAIAGFRIDVVENGALLTSIEAPWSADQLAVLRWARYGDGLILAHPDVSPRLVSRSAAGDWSIADLAFDKEADTTAYLKLRAPFAKLAGAQATIQPSFGTSSPDSAIAVDKTITLTSSDPVFTADHIGVRMRIKGRQVVIENPQSSTVAIAKTEEELVDGKATTDWSEEAFSLARGWPATFAFYQDRLVIGGSRDMPDRLWLSKTSLPFNFGAGTDPGAGTDADAGYDDEAFSFRLRGERPQDIVSLFPGRQLQVFTGAAEWVIKGFPIAPTTVQAELQTRIGSRPAPLVEPIEVDGATLFVGTSGRELREFLYVDTEQAYQAADLAVLSRHLLDDPRDMAFDPARRLVCLALASGDIATLTVDRISNVVAWTLQELPGAALALALHDEELHLLVEIDGRVFLERLDDGLYLDHAIALASSSPTSSWEGLDPLVGKAVTMMADGRVIGTQLLGAPSVTLAEPASTFVAGLPFTHEIEPSAVSGAAGLAIVYRPVRVIVRVLDTGEITIDTGSGPRSLPLPGATDAGFSGDLTLRAMGWRRGLDAVPWRIAQAAPAPCTILAVTTDMQVNS